METEMKIIALAAVGVIGAVPALAGGLADPVVEPVVVTPPVIVAPDMDWTGFYVGAQLGYADVSADDIDADGALGGLHAGYRRDVGRTVFGAELDVNASDVSSDDDVGELDSLTRLKFMAGADLGRTLIYGTLGAAHADTTIAGEGFSDIGWVAGVGVDYAVNDSWSIGGEALYHRFDDFDDTGIDVRATTLQLRASMRF
jgi:outer membrane immunogenic protein